MAQVKLNNITKIYEGDVLAVDTADFEIPDESFTVLVGPSGCGKSILLRKIALTLMILCICIFTDNLTAEDKDRGTIRGIVLDTTPEQNPIFGVKVSAIDAAGNEYTTRTNKKGEYEIKELPAVRYTMRYSKTGYGDRDMPTKLLAAGGEISNRIKMYKKENIVTFFIKNPFGWSLFLGVAVVMTVVFILLFLHHRERGN